MSKYTKKLKESFLDDHDLSLELLLFWIDIMLTSLVVLILIGMCGG